MCGIAACFLRESSVPFSHLDILFKWSEKRGSDGFGFVHIKRNRKEIIHYTSVIPYTKQVSDIENKFKQNKLEVGDLVIAISRAAPETETTTENQPLYRDNICLVHNGAVSNYVYMDIKEKCKTKFGNEWSYNTRIDSEAIIASYLYHDKDIKQAMEYISGGVAACLYDMEQDSLFLINDFKPLAHCYIKGFGYYIASDNDCLGEIIQKTTGCDHDGICLWESFYHHYLSGGRIKRLDLDSGFVCNIKYSPRYITQKWDSNKTKINDESLCLVSASGGLDSTLTLATLKYAGYDNIIACHFKYGHRGQECEEKAITSVCSKLKIPLKIFDIEQLVKSIDDTSMLIDTNAKITTGTTQGLKKLDAWVCGRNMLFLTIMASFAESQVMKYNYSTVHLLGGFLNLTESGCIMDVEDNKVLKYDNTSVLPTHINVGDELLSFNEQTKRIEKTIVQKVMNTKHNAMYIINLKFDEGAIKSQKKHYISADHPFFVKKRGWVKASDLVVGDVVYDYNMHDQVVDDIQVVSGEYDMINYYCEPNNNFFINKTFVHNSYPDNSEYFLSSFLEHSKYSTLIGNRLKPLFCLSNLMKSDQWVLVKALKLQDVIKDTISCDRPKMIDGVPHNCSKNNAPACGSGLLSWWAAKMVGMSDDRRFYEVDEEYTPHKPIHIQNNNVIQKDINTIIDRILLPQDKLNNLKKKVKE